MNRQPGRGRGEDGTILLLSVGLCAIALLLVWAVVDVSEVFLARRDLAAAVDGTAVAAAQEIDLQALYEGGAAADLPLSAVGVRRAVADYVARTYPPADDPEQQIAGTVTPDRRAVTVTGRRTVHLPGFGTVTVTAHATATSRIRS